MLRSALSRVALAVASIATLTSLPAWGQSAPPSQPRTLSFEDRVAAQEAIERVYYRHQIGATKPFEEAVPRAVIEEKVRKYLQHTVALNVYWKTSVTDEMLQLELERMAQGTRLPDRLGELFAALGEDPFLVKECLVRPILVERLTHNFYAFDAKAHLEARRRADELRRRLADGDLAVTADHPDRTVVVLFELDPVARERGGREPWRESTDGGRVASRELSPEEFRRERARWPDASGQASAVEEERDAFVIRVVLSDTSRELRVATYVVPKRNWEQWWERVKDELQAERVASTASEDGDLPRLTKDGVPIASKVALPLCGAANTWDNGILDPGLPDPREGHTAVWTGSTMVVWGGWFANVFFDTGGRYDPATDTWQATSTLGAPTGRSRHSAVWTGDAMVVWGGYSADGFLDSGGRYDPVMDTWNPTSTTGAPSERRGHTAVWTGSTMIVWGGVGRRFPSPGGRYEPVSDSWTAISTVGAPSERSDHTAIWTGNVMVIWGGHDGEYLATGGRYDPATNSWTATSTLGAPSARKRHTAVWTGSAMVVWGGFYGYTSADPLDTGGRYDPASNTWTVSSTAGAPSARYGHEAIWTGNEMVVWGGYDSNAYLSTGARYRPATDTWTATSDLGTPSGRYEQTMVWTGSVMVVWGGFNGNGFLSTGGRYDPAANAWTPTATLETPSHRTGHTAVWTGTVMVVWGGYLYDYSSSRHLDDGGRYDPATDAWTATTTAGVPSPRSGHTAVWTGSVMVVWGGEGDDSLDTGGRYDPISDDWTPTSTVGAPSARAAHTAIWTGERMVVWGGSGISYDLDSGGRYDPATDTWAATATARAPSARHRHTAIWTGTEMLVWGGYPNLDITTGGRYNPTTDVWEEIPTAGAPSPRRESHSAVWTGNTMIIWGGIGNGYLDSGGRYNPATDTWTLTSSVGVPSPRSGHTAVWTGNVMVIWGGSGEGGADLDTGGRYDPTTDTWSPTSTAGAPSARYDHTAIWTGSVMVVWGGFQESSFPYLNTGGRYVSVGWSCNDGNPCTTDICMPAVGCAHTPAAGAACNDDDACTIGDQCGERGTCVGGPPPSCDDLNPCTADSCNSSAGCLHEPTICWKVDFAPATSQAAAGFVKDDGKVFSPSIGFGWDSVIATRARNSSNPPELDTFVFTQAENTWTAEVANGDYEICAEAGDPSFAQGPHRIRASGVTLIDDEYTAANSFASSCLSNGALRRVPVRNGRLRLSVGGTAGNTLLNDLESAVVPGDSPSIRSINFQPSGSLPPAGFSADHGEVFDSARGYGWDAPLSSRERGRPVPQVLDTFVFSPAVRTWELSVENGDYDVWYGVGDPEFAQGPHRLLVEGAFAIQDLPTAPGVFLEGRVGARVADGRLTVRIGQGTANTTINYLVVAEKDADADGHPDDQDDCPLAYDPKQSDADADGMGFACDNCPFDANPSQADIDQNGVGDACDRNDGLIVQFGLDRTGISWQVEPGCTSWNVYEGDLDVLKASGNYVQLPGSNSLARRRCGHLTASSIGPDDPPAAKTVFLLVTCVSSGIEGSLGQDSTGVERPNANPCP